MKSSFRSKIPFPSQNKQTSMRKQDLKWQMVGCISHISSWIRQWVGKMPVYNFFGDEPRGRDQVAFLLLFWKLTYGRFFLSVCLEKQ